MSFAEAVASDIECWTPTPLSSCSRSCSCFDLSHCRGIAPALDLARARARDITPACARARARARYLVRACARARARARAVALGLSWSACSVFSVGVCPPRATPAPAIVSLVKALAMDQTALNMVWGVNSFRF